MAEIRIAHKSGIYEIVNMVNGKRYIGSAVNVTSRRNEHWMHLRRGTHHSRALQSACNKYSIDVFTFKVLLFCDPVNLLMYEQSAMDSMCPDYNILKIAGSSIGSIRTPETRAKIAAKAKGRKYSAETIEKRAIKRRGVKLSPEHRATLIGNKRALGHKHTEEWKVRESLRMTGAKRPRSPEHAAKLSAALKGISHSPERRAVQAAAQRGTKRGPYKPMSQETRERAIALRRQRPNPLLGRKRRPEEVAKMAVALRGRKLSEQQKANITKGLLAAWARRKVNQPTLF